YWQKKIFTVKTTPEGETIKELKPRYKRSNLMLYDAEIYAVAGGESSQQARLLNGWVEFESKLQSGSPRFESRPSVFVLALGDSKKEVTRNYRTAVQQSVRLERSQRKRYDQVGRRVPTLRLRGYPEIEELFRVTPQVVESAKINEVGMTRACPSSYYWVWGWDNLVTGMELSKWGDIEYLKKMVEFFRTHRSLDGSTPGRWTRHWEPMDSRGIGGTDFLYISLVMELYNHTMDKSVLAKCYPTIKFVFDALAGRSDEKGFFKTIGMYPDFPRRLGRNNNSYVAQDEGAWYCMCRQVEMIGYLLGDTRTSLRAQHLASRIKAQMAGESCAQAGRRRNLSKDTRRNQNREGGDKPVDQERVEK
ncbi:MAG: hypothetical protein AABZ61_05255, partial [Bacteroidota bacterium]